MRRHRKFRLITRWNLLNRYQGHQVCYQDIRHHQSDISSVLFLIKDRTICGYG